MKKALRTILKRKRRWKVSKIIELAKKLKALADRGVGGEKDNAEKILSNFLKKHNLAFDEIEEEKIDHYFFSIDPNYQKLLNQIVKNVDYSLSLYGELDKETIKKHKMPGNYFTECTASQFVLISSMFDFYKKVYDDEVRVFFTAFCTANDLLSTPPPEQQRSLSELSPEELRDYRKANRMAEGITKKQYFKSLNIYEP